MNTVHIAVGPVTVEMIQSGDRVVWHERRDPGGFEPQSRAVWAEMIQPNYIAIDVGAYTGLYAIAAAKLGAMSFAIEPISANAARLRENAELNGVWIEIVEAAASDHDGTAEMFAAGNGSLPSGAKIARTSKGRSWGAVQMFRLDSLLLRGVAAVKMDVERHEARALRGAVGMFTRDRPALLIETLGDGERLAVEAALPGYVVDETLDHRNLLMTPRAKRCSTTAKES